MTISIERMKSILNSQKLSDKEVEVIRDELRAMAQILFQKWLLERNKVTKKEIYGK